MALCATRSVNWLIHLFQFRQSKVRCDDIYLTLGGDTWHQNHNQVGSHISLGSFLL
jgi:hypothetical protein